MNSKHKSCSNAMMESEMNEAFPFFSQHSKFFKRLFGFPDHQQRSYFMYFRQPPIILLGRVDDKYKHGKKFFKKRIGGKVHEPYNFNCVCSRTREISLVSTHVMKKKQSQ